VGFYYLFGLNNFNLKGLGLLGRVGGRIRLGFTKFGLTEFDLKRVSESWARVHWIEFGPAGPGLGPLGRA
jgi:hypothetical protein